MLSLHTLLAHALDRGGGDVAPGLSAAELAARGRRVLSSWSELEEYLEALHLDPESDLGCDLECDHWEHREHGEAALSLLRRCGILEEAASGTAATPTSVARGDSAEEGGAEQRAGEEVLVRLKPIEEALAAAREHWRTLAEEESLHDEDAQWRQLVQRFEQRAARAVAEQAQPPRSG